MKNTTKLGLITITLAVALSTPVFAQSKGSNKGENKGKGPNYSMVERARGGSADCDGSGSGLCTPAKDGSDKALNGKGKGEGRGAGTPLRDGSGSASGGKGLGKNADGSCPNG